MHSLLDKVTGKARRHKDRVYLAYVDIMASGLPVSAVINALLAQGWEAVPECESMAKALPLEEKC